MKRQLVGMSGMIVIIFIHAAFASQQGIDVNNLVTLEDYIRYALQHSAALKSSYEQWRMSLEEIPRVKVLPDPQVKYGYYTRQSDMQMEQMAEIMQMFPWFGKIDALTETAQNTAAASKQRYETARLALFREVKEGFYEYVYLRRATDIARENLELSKHFEEIAQTKHLTAEAGHPDVIRAQIETAKIEDILAGLAQLREPTQSRLRTALTLPSDTNLPWPKADEFNVAELDYEWLISAISRNNPELAGLNFESMAAKTRIELAKKDFYPDIGVGIEWTGFERSGGMSGRDSVAVVFQMNLPLWRDSYSAGVRQTRAQRESIEQRKIQTENELLMRASQVYYGYRESVRKIRLYRDTLIPKGAELLRSSEAAYKAGKIDFLSLLDAQRMLLEYHLSYQRALADNREKLAELEMLTGTELN